MRYMCPRCKSWVSDDHFICEKCNFGATSIEREYFLNHEHATKLRTRNQIRLNQRSKRKILIVLILFGASIISTEIIQSQPKHQYNQTTTIVQNEHISPQAPLKDTQAGLYLAIFSWISICLFVLYITLYFFTEKGHYWRTEVKPRITKWNQTLNSINKRKDALELELRKAKQLKFELQEKWFNEQPYPSVKHLQEFYGVGEGLISLLLQNGIYNIGQIYGYKQLESIHGIGPNKAEILINGRSFILNRWQSHLSQKYHNDIYPNQHRPKVIEREQAALVIEERLNQLRLTVDLRKVQKNIKKSKFLYWFIFSPDRKIWEELTQDLKSAWTLLLIQPPQQRAPARDPSWVAEELAKQAQPLPQVAAPPQPAPPPDLEPPPQRELTTVWHRPSAVHSDPFSKLVKQCGSEEKAWIHILQNYYEPSEFERFVGSVWSALGYQVQVTKSSGDQGVDVIALRGAERIAIECKRYKGSVTPDIVRGIAAHLNHKRTPATMAVIVTTGKFTKQSEGDAKDFGVTLIGPKELARLIRDTGVMPDLSKLG